MSEKDDPKIRGSVRRDPASVLDSLASDAPPHPLRAAFKPIARRPWRRRGAVITVSGFCSGVGKTAVVESVLRVLRPAAALKITVVDSGAAACPIGRACGVCAALTVPFEIVTDRRRIEACGKDTGRYHAAGAAPVVWVKTHASHLRHALIAGLDQVGDRPLVVEGNSAVPLLAPDLAIMVDRSGTRRETKPSAARLLGAIDMAIHNRPRWATSADVDAARWRLARDLPGVPVVELDARHAPAAGDATFIHSLERAAACGART